MRIYISADIEGISGVVSLEQCDQVSREYQRARHLMTSELSAAVAGAIAGGAQEVLVNDGHGGKKNLVIEELDPRARLVTGDPKPLTMMAGIDRSFAGAMLVGYHSRACSRGVLNHTVSGRIRRFTVNGREVGEAGMNAGIAGYFGVPVIMVSGDDILEQEVRDFPGNVEYARVKVARGRYAAECLTPTAACDLITERAKRAVERLGQFKPVDLGSPVTIEVVWQVSSQADAAMMLPGAERIDDTTVRYTHPDYITAFHCFRAMVAISG
jgi:D-amino peptidase